MLICGKWGPFMTCALGSLSCDENYETFFKNETNFDNRWNAYKKNQAAMEETWKEVFVIKKSQAIKQRIHALTPYIFKSYLQKNKETEEFNYSL